MKDTTKPQEASNEQTTPSQPNTASKRIPATLALRQLLIPLDFSGESRQAITAALPLAQAFNAKINLVHIVPPVVTWDGVQGAIPHIPTTQAGLVDAARERLENMMETLVPEVFRGQALLREGNPSQGIVAAAETLGIDLIVISTHGYTGLKHTLLGSVAEKVVRFAPCSVLTVRRPGAHVESVSVTPDARELRWRTILVPLDLSKSSLVALHVAVPLASLCGATLLLLNVVEPAPYGAGFEGVVLALPEETQVKNASKHLPELAQRLVPASLKVETLVVQGRAAQMIGQIAAERDVDLIVQTTLGHRGLERALLGSTAEHVVRLACCPIYTVRNPAQERE